MAGFIEAIRGGVRSVNYWVNMTPEMATAEMDDLTTNLARSSISEANEQGARNNGRENYRQCTRLEVATDLVIKGAKTKSRDSSVSTLGDKVNKVALNLSTLRAARRDPSNATRFNKIDRAIEAHQNSLAKLQNAYAQEAENLHTHRFADARQKIGYLLAERKVGELL
jgi:hypothetical protein